jgi:hypothetical protein
MSYIFDMSVGEIEAEEASIFAASTESHVEVSPREQYQLQCQLRLLTVAEAEEQRPVPRPRPWLFAM